MKEEKAASRKIRAIRLSISSSTSASNLHIKKHMVGNLWISADNPMYGSGNRVNSFTSAMYALGNRVN